MERKRYSATAEQKNGIKSAIAEILVKAEDIHSAYIFGSFIDDDMPFRDIDLGVFFAGNNRLQISEAAVGSATILSRKTACPVDVRVLNYAPVAFVYNVLRGELIYEKNADTRCQVMEKTVRDYLDIKPILCQATKEAFAHESQP